eukprot:27519-Amphidinium_carterae.1
MPRTYVKLDLPEALSGEAGLVALVAGQRDFAQTSWYEWISQPKCATKMHVWNDRCESKCR